MAEPQKTGMWYTNLTRRRFLQKASLLTAGIALAPVIAACAPSTPEAQELLEALNETAEQRRYRMYCDLDINEAVDNLHNEGLGNYAESFSANYELITTFGAGLFSSINDGLLPIAAGNRYGEESISILRDDWVQSPSANEVVEDAHFAIDTMGSVALDTNPHLRALFHKLADRWGLQFLLMNGFDIDPNITAGLTHYLGKNSDGIITMGDMPSPEDTGAIEDYLYILFHELNHNADGWYGLNLPRLKIIKKYVPQPPVASYMSAYTLGVYELLRDWQALDIGTAVNKYNPVHVANFGVRSSTSDTSTTEREKEVIGEDLELWTGALGMTRDEIAAEIEKTNPTNMRSVYTQKGYVAHMLASQLFKLKEAKDMPGHNELVKKAELLALIFGKSAGDIRFESLVQTAGHRFVYARHSGEIDFYEGSVASLTDPYHESVDNARIKVFARNGELPTTTEYAMSEED